MAHKIAIITTRDYTRGYGDDYDDYGKIIESITDWQEVSDEDFKTLQYAAPRLNFAIVEQPTDTKKFIAKSIADYTAIAKAEAIRDAEEKQKRADAALARKFKKELKDKDSKIKMLKRLQEELGPDLY
jgi:predicted ATP-dependent endonuclease of OLD family